MKKMSTKAQMQANGGAYTHCHDCDKTFWGLTKKLARNAVMKHRKKTGHYWWDYGEFDDCPNK